MKIDFSQVSLILQPLGRSLRAYFLAASLIFAISIVIGWQIGSSDPETSRLVIAQLEEKFSSVKNAAAEEIFFFIFINNTLIDAAAIFLFFIGGLVPVLLLAGNGLTIGLVVNLLRQDFSTTQLIAALIPHGIIEIPAFLMAGAVGFWLNWQMILRIFYKKPFFSSLKSAFFFFLIIIVPLNFTAALIETFITPLILNFFLK
jgi:stage II sporulation protein M